MLEAFRHLVHAAGYSAAGLRHMFATQIAARIELALAVGSFLWFLVIGRSFGEFAILVVLYLALIGVEAMNTAIEEIVDHLSPDHSKFAEVVKDLGSAVVFCFSCAAGLYVLAITADWAGIVSFYGS